MLTYIENNGDALQGSDNAVHLRLLDLLLKSGREMKQ